MHRNVYSCPGTEGRKREDKETSKCINDNGIVIYPYTRILYSRKK